MARIEGPGIDKNASYTAVELWGKGMFRLEKEKPSQPDLAAPVGVKISRESARKIGRWKLPNETLGQVVERLALDGLAQKKRAD